MTLRHTICHWYLCGWPLDFCVRCIIGGDVGRLVAVCLLSSYSSCTPDHICANVDGVAIGSCCSAEIRTTMRIRHVKNILIVCSKTARLKGLLRKLRYSTSNRYEDRLKNVIGTMRRSKYVLAQKCLANINNYWCSWDISQTYF